MLRIFGLGEGAAMDSEAEIGWGEERENGVVNVSWFVELKTSSNCKHPGLMTLR